MEDPLLALERQIIQKLAQDDISHQPRGRQAALDRLGKPGGNRDMSLAIRAGVLWSPVDQDLQAVRNVLELFSRLLAHRTSLDAALGAELLFGRQIVNNLLPREA